MAPDSPLGNLLGQLARRVLDQVAGAAAGAGRATPQVPEAGTAGVDALLPPVVGAARRTFVNDRLGGLERGGVFAGYDAGGHEVRVIVRRAASEGAARGMVARAPAGPGHHAWCRGALWYSASGGTVQGDEDPVLGPGDVEAFDRFLADWGPEARG